MKRKVYLFDVNLSGLAQGLSKDVVIHALPSVILKGVAEKNKSIRDNYSIDVKSVFVNEQLQYYKKIAAENLFMVGFSTYTWNYKHIQQASRLLKKNNPNILIIWGGPQVSYTSEIEMQNNEFIDFIVSGAGEEAFRDLLLHLLSNKANAQNKISSLAYRVKDAVIKNPIMHVDDLEGIPSPFQNQLIKLDAKRKHAVYVETFRGCPNKCGYCIWGGGKKKLQFFPIAQVLEDIKIIYNTENIENVYFVDACLFYHPQRAIQILNTILECQYLHPTFLEFDPIILKPEYVPLIKRVCKSDYRLGVQSFVDDTLQNAGRSHKGRELIRNQVEMLRNEDKEAYISFALIYGLPKDNLKGFKATLDFALTLKPESLKINVLSVLPGTPFWTNKRFHKLEFEELPPHRLLYSKDFSQRDIEVCEKITAWLTYLLKFPIYKKVLYSLIDENFISSPITFVENTIERLSPNELWIQKTFKKSNISVEKENENRIEIINQSEKTENRLRVLKILKEQLSDFRYTKLLALVNSELDFFNINSLFKHSSKNESWKR
jgi:radical SAM superfamily enzyme YgiQ (UPF0313 family)